MFVSTKVLSLMQFVSTGSNHTTHMKAVIEQRHGLSLRTLVGFFLPNERFNLLGKETADGGGTACGENSHLLERLPSQAYGHVLLRCIHVSRMIRVTRIIRAVKCGVRANQ